jgi:nitrogen fixation-related uncharacterized protein
MFDFKKYKTEIIIGIVVLVILLWYTNQEKFTDVTGWDQKFLCDLGIISQNGVNIDSELKPESESSMSQYYDPNTIIPHGFTENL